MPQIPQIIAEGPHPERLGVPEAPRVPTENPVYQAADEFNSQIGEIGAKLQNQQTKLDFGAAQNQYAQQVTNARVSAMQQPYDRQISTFKAASDPANMISDPANAHIASLLAVHLPEMQQSAMQDVQLSVVKAQEAAQKQQLSNQLDQSAQQMISAPSRMSSAAIHASLATSIDGAVSLGTVSSEEGAAMQRQLASKVAYGALQASAITDPSNTMIELSRPDFLQRNPDVTAEQWGQLRNDITTQADYASRAVESSLKADMAEREQGILAKVASGQPYASDLASLRAHYSESDQFYRSLTGQPWVENIPSAPGLVGTYQQQIKDMTADGVDQVAANIDMAVANRSLNPRDGALLKQLHALDKTKLKNGLEAQVKQQKSTLYDEFYTPKSKLDGMIDMDKAKLPGDTFENHWNAALGRNPTDPVKAASETRDELNALLKTRPGISSGAAGRLLSARH